MVKTSNASLMGGGVSIYIYVPGAHGPPSPPPRHGVPPPPPPVGVGVGSPRPPCGCGVWDLSSIAADIAAASCQDHLQHVVSLLPY